MRKIIYPYKMGSISSKELAQELGAIRVYPDRKYRPRDSDIIINWGSGKIPNWYDGARKIYNEPRAVNIASDKIRAFENLDGAGVPTLDWTTDRYTAGTFDRIVVRHITRGNGGAGIEITTPDEGVPYAPLYTRFIDKKEEFRVHIFNGEVIDYTQKKRKKEFEGKRDEVVRNHENGWVFCRKDINYRDDVVEVAKKAIKALGLDFGGVDIATDEYGVYVLEVNTACGMADETRSKYIDVINKL